MDRAILRRKLGKLASPLTARRAAALALSLPRSIMALRRLRSEAEAEGRALRLIVLPERMGDVIAAEPIARRLRAASNERLVWVIGRAFADLVRFNPNVDRRLEITCYSEWMALDALFPDLAKTRLYVDGIHCSWFGGPALRNPNPFGIHMDTYFQHGSLLEVFSKLGLGEAMDERPTVWADPGFDADGWIGKAGLSHGFVALHGGAAVSAGRVWPAERFQAVADQLWANEGLAALELGLEPVLQPRPWIRPLGGALTLAQQAAVLARARAFVGGDSGFAHMANALGLRAAVLLAPYRHFGQVEPFSGPWKQERGVAFLRAPQRIEDIEADDVVYALRRLLGDPPG